MRAHFNQRLTLIFPGKQRSIGRSATRSPLFRPEWYRVPSWCCVTDRPVHRLLDFPECPAKSKHSSHETSGRPWHVQQFLGTDRKALGNLGGREPTDIRWAEQCDRRWPSVGLAQERQRSPGGQTVVFLTAGQHLFRPTVTTRRTPDVRNLLVSLVRLAYGFAIGLVSLRPGSACCSSGRNAHARISTTCMVKKLRT